MVKIKDYVLRMGKENFGPKENLDKLFPPKNGE